MARTLFVYGTLRPGGRYWPNIAPFIEQYDPAMLGGYDLWHIDAGYPAITAGDGTVFGDLLYIGSGKEMALLRVADEIEEYAQGDATSLFLRREVQVARMRSTGGQAIPADVYVFNPAHKPFLEKHGTPMPTGEWHAPDLKT